MISFNFVTPRLATGGAISGREDLDQLAAAGVTAVINCNDGENDAALLASMLGVEYLNNPTADDGQPKPADWFDRSIQFALRLLAQPHHRVYAHCAAGVNRGPSTALAIMMALGWGKIAARAEIILHRPVCIGGVRYADDAEAAVKILGYT